MKKKIILILIVIIMMINQVMVIATGVTSYPGKSMTLENTENIDIIYNEVLIDVETSNISNIYILQNTSNSDVVIKASIPLENLIVGNRIENLEIKVNNAKVKYEIEETEEEVIYKFNIKAKANEVKKVEIKCKTQNDLNEATIIKYNMEGMKIGEKKVKKVKVNVKIRERDIPMVTQIYPPHYTFDLDTKTITVEYYNMPINNLTKNIIIEKDTLDTVLDNYNFSYDIDSDDLASGYTYEEYNREILKYLKANLDSLIQNGNNGKSIQELSGVNENFTYKYGNNEEESKYYDMIFTNIDDYLNVDYLIKNKKYKDLIKYVKIFGYEQTPILVQIIAKKYVDIDLEYGAENDLIFGVQNYEIYEGADNWLDKILIVDIADTKDEKIYVNIFGGYYEDGGDETFNFKEQYIVDILKQESLFEIVQINGANFINLATLTNEKITTQEKIDYINSVGADIYIYVDLYRGEFIEDGTWYNEVTGEEYISNWFGHMLGYNNDIGKRILDIFEKDYLIKRYTYYDYFTKKYEDYKPDEEKEYNIEEDYRKIKVTNNEYLDNIKIPSFIMYSGQIRNENGKKIYEYFNKRIFKYLANVLDDKDVKECINLNKIEIEQNKKQINQEIESLMKSIVNDEEEIEITIANKENIIYIVIGSSLLIGIIICISILIIKNKKGGSKHEK